MNEMPIAEDTLQGASEIAAYTGLSLRRTNYLLEKQQLPAFKIGNRWHMRRSTFARHIEELEAAAKRSCINNKSIAGSEGRS